MDNGPRIDVDSISESTINSPGSAPYAGAFFPSSQHLLVAGGTFTSTTANNIHYSTPSLPSNFRMIPLGDIDLRDEIRLDHDTGLVNRRSARGYVRRMYAARIDGRKSATTVALYRGDNAEEEWRHDLSAYSRLRHPNFVQIYATASSHGIHATVLHDELIPLEYFVETYRRSHFATVYIYAYCDAEFADARSYFQLVFQKALVAPRWISNVMTGFDGSEPCTFLIRRSTGRLCVDLFPSHMRPPFFFLRKLGTGQMARPSKLATLNGSTPENIVTTSLTLVQYHALCSWHLRDQRSFLPSSAAVRVGVIRSSPPSTHQLEETTEIALLCTPRITTSWNNSNDEGEVVINGWTRYNARDLSGISMHEWIDGDIEATWLAQANHIFSCLRITSNYDDYMYVRSIHFVISIPATPEAPPDGYLFRCPNEALQAGPYSFRWPDCPVYWSLDPSGVERLSAEQANKLGFPTLELKMRVYGVFWDELVYAGLRKFHEAKGFDPESQEVAKHLGYPLFQLADDLDLPFLHIDDEDALATIDENTPKSSSDETVHPEDFEHPEMISTCWRLIMVARVTLMLFLAFFWLHGCVE